MAINLNGESEQSMGGGCIPEDSICMFRMEVRQPTKPEKKTQDVWVSQSDKGIMYLDCCFEAVGGQFEGRKIFEVIALPVGMQTSQLTDGHVKWCNGSGARLRAIVEAVRNIDPKDQSQNAMNGRAIAGWHEFNGMTFPIKVGYKKIESDDKYVNNRIKAIVTPNRKEYEQVVNGVDIITDKPIPEIKQSSSPQQQSCGYGQQQYQQPQQPRQPFDGSENNNGQFDDVPF